MGDFLTEFEIIETEKDEDMQIVIGHAGFIKTVEDIHEALVNSVPGIKFGVAFVEASGKRLLRSSGNDAELEALAIKNLFKINAGHTFLIILKNAFPINVIKHIRDVNEVVNIYTATANTVKVVIAREDESRAVIGVMDGLSAKGVETDDDKKERYDLMRKFGYKL